MLKTLPVDVFECRGSPYDVGYQLATGYKKVRRTRARWPQGKLRIGSFDIEDARRTLLSFAPNIWEELRGIADGLEITFGEAVAAFSNGRLQYPQRGCSAVMSGGLYGRNYDFSPRRYDRALVAAQSTGSFASIGFADRYTGRVDGMNERGLCIGLHFVNEAIWRPGLVSILIVRILLDQCASTEAAIGLLQRLPHGLGANYSLLDADGAAAVVEAMPDRLAVRRGDWLTCTNHFQAGEMQAANRPNHGSSKRRLPPLEHWAQNPVDAFALFHLLNDARSPAFHHNYAAFAGTLHTMVCDPVKGEMLIGIGGDAAPQVFSVKAWTGGSPLGVDRLKGYLGGKDAKIFAGQDLSGAEFRDLNLASARFDDINFVNAEITANCNFKGMRLAGVPVEELLAVYRRTRGETK
ncbi:C45 family peptidase [Ferrovibrio sp.]|uniref:C45 family autoproteolytic acyltransferase/hydolase n=1 Tax=Ferrovibrio sp. TaxID=1917215 RepID=UPI0026225DB3|nr:C45 family peptidase [Ferrovibrio sp.]